MAVVTREPANEDGRLFCRGLSAPDNRLPLPRGYFPSEQMYEYISNMNQRDAVSLIFKIRQIKGKDGQMNTLIEHTNGHKIRRVTFADREIQSYEAYNILAGM